MEEGEGREENKMQGNAANTASFHNLIVSLFSSGFLCLLVPNSTLQPPQEGVPARVDSGWFYDLMALG